MPVLHVTTSYSINFEDNIRFLHVGIITENLMFIVDQIATL